MTKKTPISIKHIIKSVLGAFIGIQDHQHAQQDFKYGNLWIYIVAGITSVIIFIAIIYGIVKWIVS